MSRAERPPEPLSLSVERVEGYGVGACTLGLRFRVSCFGGLGVWGLGIWVRVSGFRVSGFGSRGRGSRVEDLGFGVGLTELPEVPAPDVRRIDCPCIAEP